MEFGIKVALKEPDDFLKVKETLSRIGISSRKEKTLYQSCHILHKRGEYYILHFKELFMLDGKTADFTDEDKRRRNVIAWLLNEWGLAEIVDQKMIEDRLNVSQIKIVPHKEKNDWEFVSKYSVGTKK